MVTDIIQVNFTHELSMWGKHMEHEQGYYNLADM